MGLKSIRPLHSLRKSPEHSIDEILLNRVSLKSDGRDPILSDIEMTLPIDVTCVVESENPLHAAEFLKLMAGAHPPTQGSVLWNQKNYFGNSEDSALDPHTMMGCYFEGQRPNPSLTVHKFWSDTLQSVYKNQMQDLEPASKLNLELNEVVRAELQDIETHFNASEFANVPMSRAPYGVQKLAQLVAIAMRRPHLLVLEDPAYGLTENSWLDFMDFIQLLQRQGFARHIYMTNTHPTALLHLSIQKIFLAGGALYVDEATRFKKVSHF